MYAEGNKSAAQFDRLCSELPGRLVVAIVRGPGCDPLVFGDDQPFHAWSTIKGPVVAALLSVVQRGGLRTEHRDLIRRAITESDNAAILELFVLLEGLTGGSSEAAGAIERLFRLSGDSRTVVARDPPPPGAITPFGQTGWTAADSARFFSALGAGRLLTAADTEYLLGLMERVVPEQRWGLGILDTRAAFKGGWGPEPDGTCLVRQSGVLPGGGVLPGRGGQPGSCVGISLIAEPPGGEESFEQGVLMLDRAAAWFARRVS